MKRIITKSLALVALVGAMTAYSTSKAEAALNLYLCTEEFCVGGTTIIVDDGGAGDVNASAGAITYVGGFAGFDAFSVNSAVGVPALGSDSNPQLDLHFSAFGSGDGYIYAQQGDFTLPNPPSFTLNYGGTSTGSVWVQGIVGVNGDPWTTAGPYTGPFSGSLALSNDNVPYFQAIGVHVVQGEGGATTGNLHLVPEPITLSLLGLGLAGVAARRRRQNA